jgi:hypothetical protein
MKWIVILFLDFSTLYSKVKILVIWNNHESNVLMNCRVMYVYNQGMSCECVHIVMKIYCYNIVE